MTARTGVTVIVPTIGPRRDLLTRALTSIAAQTHQPDAILVAYDRHGEGAWKTRNRALALVDTTWVAFLDDDDEWLPQHLERCVDHQHDTGADLVFPWFDVVGGTDPFTHFGQPWDPANPVQTTIVTLVRTSALRAVGGFTFEDGDFHDDGGNRAGEDYEMVKRLNAAGYRISHLPERTWLWHHHGRNTMGLPERVGALYSGGSESC